ncbi:caspase-1-like [Vespa mandarinia]|uniref:caspase-1-like n=1 Tax=Vespa mandarinia TaxID=7446 RepID=UPI00160E4EC2|nr:caspase-1-like [Vespa mandarinia]
MFNIVFCIVLLTNYVMKYLIRKNTSNKIFRSFSNVENISKVDSIDTEVRIDADLQFVHKNDNKSPNFISTSRSNDVVDAIEFRTINNYYESPKISRTTPIVGAHDLLYNMNYDNRGKCVIFNHAIFEINLDERKGTNIDAMRIKDVFTQLGFEVLKYDDLTYMEVKDMISTLSNEDHSKNDCICIFVLTHGTSNDLLYSKDVAYSTSYIWKPFSADLCTSLAGKPKLFFFQACRGNNTQEPFELRCNADISVTDSSTSYKIPTHADFLIGHSTIEGSYSFRNEKYGSCYIQSLCDTLEQYANTKDLLSILTITARKVAIEFISHNNENLANHNKKQIPSMTSMLIRDLYLKPKKK